MQKLVCDVCPANEGTPVYRYAVRGAIFVRTNENGADVLDDSDWMLCAACAEKVESRDVKTLVKEQYDATDRLVLPYESMKAQLKQDAQRRTISFVLNHGERTAL